MLAPTCGSGSQEKGMAWLSARFPSSCVSVTSPHRSFLCALTLSLIVSHNILLLFLQGGDPRNILFLALQVELLPVERNPILPSEFIYLWENVAHKFFPIVCSITCLEFHACIQFTLVSLYTSGCRGFNLSCKLVFTFYQRSLHYLRESIKRYETISHTFSQYLWPYRSS